MNVVNNTMINLSLKKLKSFRQAVHGIFPAYSDAAMDLIDALSTDQNATSITALSENKFFRRKYSSITKVIRNFLVPWKKKDLDNEKGSKPKPAAKENPEIDFRPNKELQKAIQRQIFNFCCKPPVKRNFFYLPVM
jgi:hypothetical protein